jgi:acylphosphatase
MPPNNLEGDNIRKHLYVSGIVQGVFFRDTARRQAVSLGVKGYVRNLPDGRVEVVAEGDRDGVGKFIRWCRCGPAGARVTHVDIRDERYLGEYQDFRIERTA